MRRMIIEVVLIALLGSLGWALHLAAARDERRAKVLVEANENLLLGQYTGFDLGGVRATPAMEPGTERLATFLLRATSLESDLATWQQVAHELRNEQNVKLVAFCDGLQCASAIRVRAKPLQFPIMMYTEMVNAQALLNADSLGRSVVQTTTGGPFSVEWRHASMSPREISLRILER